ncbi:hypothetical protein NN561_020394 [Cricetulus griseus]
MRQGYAKEGEAKKRLRRCKGGGSAALRRRRRRLSDASGASSLFPLGPVGGAPQRPEREGGGCWSLGFLSFPGHGRSARNLLSSVPTEVDCRGPVLGAGLGPCRREERMKIVHGLRQARGYGTQRVGESTGYRLHTHCIQIWELASTLKTNAAGFRIKLPTIMCVTHGLRDPLY